MIGKKRLREVSSQRGFVIAFRLAIHVSRRMAGSGAGVYGLTAPGSFRRRKCLRVLRRVKAEPVIEPVSFLESGTAFGKNASHGQLLSGRGVSVMLNIGYLI